MAEIIGLADGIRRLVRDGSVIALEGFSHLVPFAAGHEILRQRPRDLTIIRMVPDLIVDQMIGAGLVKRLTFAWGGNPGVGSLHRFREGGGEGLATPHRARRALTCRTCEPLCCGSERSALHGDARLRRHRTRVGWRRR